MQPRRAVFATFVGLAVSTSNLGCAANTGVAPPPTATAAISGTITINRPTPLPALTPPPAVARQLNVNTASVTQMRAAFAAAGILGAAEWANAIEDGRPYSADDPSWSQVRGVLSRAGAPASSIEQIVALLMR